MKFDGNTLDLNIDFSEEWMLIRKDARFYEITVMRMWRLIKGVILRNRERERGGREREREGGGKKLGVVENITLKAGQVRSQ